MESLDKPQRTKILWTLNLIRNQHPIPAQYFQKMSGIKNLWEVRVIFGGNIFRILGFLNMSGKLILCHGFTKKTQKTPLREIETTLARKNEYEKRN